MSDGHPARATMAFGIEADDEPSHHLESLRIEPIRNRSHRPGIERSLEALRGGIHERDCAIT
jgi:hypothetical protein